MKIIDRDKDYYGYLSPIYGVDGNTVFDRQGHTGIRRRQRITALTKNLVPAPVPRLLRPGFTAQNEGNNMESKMYKRIMDKAVYAWHIDPIGRSRYIIPGGEL
jgi:hypothetical protein